MAEDMEAGQVNPYAIPGKDIELIKWEEQYDEQIRKMEAYLKKYFNDEGVEKLIEKIKSKAGKHVSLGTYEHNQIADIMIYFEWDLAQQIIVNCQEWGKEKKIDGTEEKQIYDMTDYFDIVHHIGDFVFAVYQKAFKGEGRRVHASQYQTVTHQTIMPEKKRGLLGR